MPSRSIRSSAHRHILVWLRHGSSTVSEIATQFGMRMPHASLACRQLREAGLITRDESGGLRNAPLFLSQQGVERLTEDAVSKMMQYADVLSSAKKPMVLHADDANVLLAYTHLPETSLVFVPDPAAVDGSPSSGNKGGVWVLAPKQNIRWYHLSDGTSADPPLSRGNTLADFQPSVERVGLVRGEVFEVRGDARLAEAQFFPTGEDELGQAPSRLQLGEVVVGTVAGTSHAYSPEQGLRCHLHSALNRSLLLQSLGEGALEIGDRHAIKHRSLPYGVLNEWLMLKHPRMTTLRIEELYNGLVAVLDDGTSTTPSVLEREVLMDFGRVSWTTSPLEVGYLDLYGMTGRGASALLRFVANTISAPFIVDWPFEDVDDELVMRLLAHPLCRSFVSRRGPPPSPGLRRSVLFDGEEMGFVSARQGRFSAIEVQLNAPGTSPMQAGTVPFPSPLNALELMNRHSVSTTESFTGEVFEGEGGRVLAEALRLYPQGDEQQANMWEQEHPLAAWIASPVVHRPARWMRLHPRLPEGWTDLLGVEALSLEHLPLAMKGASPGWQRLVLRRIQSTAQVDAGVLVQWRTSVKSNVSTASAYATCLLCSLHPERSEEAVVFGEAAEVWFREPMCEQEVLESVLQERAMNEDLLAELRSGWRLLAEKQPKSSLLHAWSVALRIAQNREPWVPEMQRMLMERLPPAWWAVYAGQWLTTQLSSHAGRTWLQSFTCSWAVQLARPEGEPTRFPGLDGLHPGFRLTTESLLGANLLSGEGEHQPLRDLYEMVYAHEQGLPVPLLQTHPFAGWLVRPVHQWPRFGSEVLQIGDPKVGELLFARSFAARTPTAGR